MALLKQGTPIRIQWPAWRPSGRHFFLLGLLLVPLVVNFLVFQFFLKPRRQEVKNLQGLTSLVKLKPRIEALIAESNELMAQKVAKVEPGRDVNPVLKEIRGLAREHKVEVRELRVRTETGGGKAGAQGTEVAGYKKVSVSMDMAGNYSRIARWLAALDRKMEIRVEDFTLEPSSAGDCQLRLDLVILLRKP